VHQRISTHHISVKLKILVRKQHNSGVWKCCSIDWQYVHAQNVTNKRDSQFF